MINSKRYQGQIRELVLFTITSVEKFRFFTAENYPSVNALVVGIIEIKLTSFVASGTASFTPLLMRYLYF
jgi:hypothetical protein